MFNRKMYCYCVIAARVFANSVHKTLAVNSAMLQLKLDTLQDSCISAWLYNTLSPSVYEVLSSSTYDRAEIKAALMLYIPNISCFKHSSRPRKNGGIEHAPKKPIRTFQCWSLAHVRLRPEAGRFWRLIPNG